jgi:hypothetical protein
MSERDGLWIIDGAPEAVGALEYESVLQEVQRQLVAHPELPSLTIVRRPPGGGGPAKYEVVMRD